MWSLASGIATDAKNWMSSMWYGENEAAVEMVTFAEQAEVPLLSQINELPVPNIRLFAAEDYVPMVEEQVGDELDALGGEFIEPYPG